MVSGLCAKEYIRAVETFRGPDQRDMRIFVIKCFDLGIIYYMVRVFGCNSASDPMEHLPYQLKIKN